MHITFLTPTLETHGGTLVLKEYATHLFSQGHQVEIISPNRGNLSFPNGISIKKYRPVSVRFLDTILFQSIYFTKILKSIDPQTDCIIPIYTPLLVPALLAKRKHPHTKLVLLAQESFEMPLIGWYNRQLLKSYLVQSKLQTIISVSHPLQKQIETLIKFPKLRVNTIPNGIEHEYFFPVPGQQHKNEILFVGRPNNPKGYPDYLKAVKLVQTQFPNYIGRIVAPLKKLETPEGVSFTAYQSRKQLAELYRQAFVFVSASKGESFGLPALEAMASGTPTVLTKTVGSSEYAIDGENTLLAPIGNPQELAKKIITLIKNPDLYAKLQQSGLDTAQIYRWDKAKASFDKVIEP